MFSKDKTSVSAYFNYGRGDGVAIWENEQVLTDSYEREREGAWSGRGKRGRVNAHKIQFTKGRPKGEKVGRVGELRKGGKR